LPLTASEVDTTRPFSPEELLYRRVGPDELNSMGEVLPTKICGVSFKPDVKSSPSVMRSDFCEPVDVLHVLCATKEVLGWMVYFIRVDDVPGEIQAPDKTKLCFFPMHIPEETCGAHSVIACCLFGDAKKAYKKPTARVAYDFKVKFALGLKPIGQIYDIESREPLAAVSG
jgi:hypothetical protein